MHPIEKTLRFVINAHADQALPNGDYYWWHPFAVMLSLGPYASITAQQVALLHDVLEDTPYTAEDLKVMEFSDSVINAVVILTRGENQEYMDYIRAIKASKNQIAIEVKLADLRHNIDPDRVAQLPASKRGIVKRYNEAIKILTEKNNA
jgi:(p)ppGpp synthase/HD superfamily hydrolase